ncbi:MAG TPA: hypothetical protein VFS90_24180 [Pyrinomonadaceae bacterium]|nr:hypothetical protein [Pyrinomonadaceae bacterium]
MPGPHPGFNKNVFINCPFDRDYNSLLKPILFTIIYFGFTPQIASETTDSGEQRIDKVVSLILKSRYSLHDLSRIKSRRRGEYFRLNMPFELGIDYGCRRTSARYLRRKKFLVLGAKSHDFKQALSDLSGIDAKSHGNNPKNAALAVRNWFIESVHLQRVPSASAIWQQFLDFSDDFYAERKKDGFSPQDLKLMPVREYIAAIRHWLKTHS